MRFACLYIFRATFIIVSCIIGLTGIIVIVVISGIEHAHILIEGQNKRGGKDHG